MQLAHRTSRRWFHGFEKAVVEAEKLVDKLVDPTLITYLRTERGSALGREIANFMATDSEINVQQTA